MLKVFLTSWALLLGMMLLMIGNGLQGTLMGVRGAIEGFSTFNLSLITSAYFLGFLGGSRLTPEFIRRVGHVRVFAALGSFISAVLIMYPVITDPYAWILLRVIVGFCFSGVYVTAESWLNNATTNETRGQTLSLYLIVQMVGIVISQGLLNVADPAGFILFIIPSVLVSISFAPILLSVQPTPAFDSTSNMSLRRLYSVSPLGFVGIFILGGVFSAQFGMSAVYATQIGMSVAQVSVFVSAIFVGAMIMQYPIGWLSDKIDRRQVILAVCVIAGLACVVPWLVSDAYPVLLVAAFILGGCSNPLYGLLLAYTNDYLETHEMAGASGGLLFVNGLGAVAGPVLTGWLMTTFGSQMFWGFIFVLMAATALYAAYRMTQRASLYAQEHDYEAVPYAPIGLGGTQVAAEAAQDYYAYSENAGETAELSSTETQGEKS